MTEIATLDCPNCYEQGKPYEIFDVGGLPAGVVVCASCFETIDTAAGKIYDGPLDTAQAELEAELRSIGKSLDAVKDDPRDQEYRRGFIEGRAFEFTRKFEKHPEFWNDRFCNCDQCGDRA